MRGFFGLIAVSNICSTNAASVVHYAYQPYEDNTFTFEEEQRVARKNGLSWNEDDRKETMPELAMTDEQQLQKFLPTRQRQAGTFAGTIQAATGIVNSGGYMWVQLAFTGKGKGAKFTYPATFTDFLDLQKKFKEALVALKSEASLPLDEGYRSDELNAKYEAVSAIDVNQAFPMSGMGKHFVPVLASAEGRARKLRNWLQSMLMTSNLMRGKIGEYMDHMSKDWETLRRLKTVFEDWFMGLERYYQQGQPGMDQIGQRMMSNGQLFSHSPYSGKPPQQFDFWLNK